MELTPQEKSQHWWKGTITGAMKGLAVGLAVGAASALLLQFVLIPLFPAIGLPAIGDVFASFLTLTPGAASPAFSMIPLAIFSGVSGLISGLFTGGRSEVTAYHQDRHNKLQMHQDQKLNELGGKVQQLEQAMPVSRTVHTILTKGPAKDQSFADTETQKRSEADKTHSSQTIH